MIISTQTCKKHLFGLRLCKILYKNPDKNTMVYVRKNKKDAYIVIKGTNRMNHWIHNLSIFLTEEGMHSGFNQFSELCKAEIKADIDAYMETNMNDLKYIENIHLISHSLGASALIILLYNEMIKDNGYFANMMDNVNVDIVLVGAPKSGNKIFSEKFNEILKKFKTIQLFRYSIENDLVSIYPPWNIYEHVCEEIKMKEQKTLLNIIHNHSLYNYINNLRIKLNVANREKANYIIFPKK